MYKNRIQRTANNLDVQSLIRRCDIAFDQRARYVEFVCSIWNEGRFGPDLADPVTVNWHHRPEPEPKPLYDRFDLWDARVSTTCGSGWLTMGPDDPRSLGRAGSQKIDAASRREKQMGLLATNPLGTYLTSDYSANQGRGSP